MKRPLQIYSALSLLSDVLAVSFAFALSYVLRFHVQVLPLTKGLPPLKIYLGLFPVALMVWISASAAMGLYSSQRKYSYFDEAFAVAKAGSVAVVILVALTFFYRDYTFSRLMLLLFWGTSILVSVLARSTLLYSLRRRYLRGSGLESVLVIGAGPLGQIVARKIGELPQLGFRVVGFLDDAGAGNPGGGGGPKVLGTVGEVVEVVRRLGVHHVFIALPRESHRQLEECLSRLDKEMVEVRVVPDILQFVFLKAGLENLDGIPIIHLADTPLSGWYGPVKRTADIVFSLACLILLSPLFMLVAALVKLSSEGPVFYRQERMSLDGSLFTMLKFRTMREDAESGTGPVWASRHDPRRTAVGAFLRRFSLDELPQLINVLRGEMSFVGPRPERPVFVEQFREKVPRYMLRHKVKCGLTGWAQVNGWRGNTSIEKRIEYDIFYIENWSMSFDLKIIWLTLRSGLVSKHAY